MARKSSERTVSTRLVNIYEKLERALRAELTAMVRAQRSHY
jgi:DNA-binding NarL/FixJ family response regulator